LIAVRKWLLHPSMLPPIQKCDFKN
jgi:hypothetical protein